MVWRSAVLFVLSYVVVPTVCALEPASKEAEARQPEKQQLAPHEIPELPKKPTFLCAPGDSEFKFQTRLRLPDFFYGRNLRLLNDSNPTDQVLYFRHIADFILQYRYGRPSIPYDVTYVKMTIRNKGVWGDPESIASTLTSPVNDFGTAFGSHTHGIPLHIIWIRELWAQFSLRELLRVPFCNNHTVTLGAFPFVLGRGIALGPAYAVDASDLGFISEYAIDQYAFGGKLSGELLKDSLIYDLYGAILDNKAGSFNQVNEKINAQRYFRRNDQARGFGVINFVVAGRLKWRPTWRFKGCTGHVEPYLLYNRNPEQRIAFRGDAQSQLLTLGIASEHEFGRFEWGFDTAYNFGGQSVFGWDANSKRLENRKGTVTVVNSRVRQAPPGQMATQKSPLALHVPENQAIIDTSPQTQLENGQVIGTNELGMLINDRDRFTDGYRNKYRGSMFVFDMGYMIWKPELKVAVGMGYASGDANPNKDQEFRGDNVQDQLYEGFIGLQEVYSGTRIKSGFMLSGAGRIPRPLSFPSEQVRDPFAPVVSRFTNLVFVGGSCMYRPGWACRKWRFNPNILAYWNDRQAPFFDAAAQQNLAARSARSYLGLELNLFVEAEILPDLKFYSENAVFIPGDHYTDITGRPLNRAQQAFLNNRNRTGIVNDRVPLLADDTAYFFRMGLEYIF